MKNRILPAVVLFCLPILGGYQVAKAVDATPQEVASFTVALDPDVSPWSEAFSSSESDYEMYSDGYSCGEGDQTTCQNRCVDYGNEHYGGGWILMAVTCSMDSEGMAHCGCAFSPAGPTRPPCYWNCGGSRGRLGY